MTSYDLIIDRKRALFIDIMYETEVHEALNTKLKNNNNLSQNFDEDGPHHF